MENRRKSSSSGELFSFSSTRNQDQDSDFEFGFFAHPDSPSLDPHKTSPADHLFLNGRLLPHSFPVQVQPSRTTTTTTALADAGSRWTSRTSSINSKHSLMWSRSDSTNSRSSTSSSARTSSSDCTSDQRRLLYHNRASKLVTHRRQYTVTAVPVMKREVISIWRKNGDAKKQGHHLQQDSVSKGKSSGCLRFFRLFLLACRECHAMEPSRKQKEF